MALKEVGDLEVGEPNKKCMHFSKSGPISFWVKTLVFFHKNKSGPTSFFKKDVRARLEKWVHFFFPPPAAGFSSSEGATRSPQVACPFPK